VLVEEVPVPELFMPEELDVEPAAEPDALPLIELLLVLGVAVDDVLDVAEFAPDVSVLEVVELDP
jgi:hypothetical protein